MRRDSIVRDERFYSVENASYRIGFQIMLFGTMILCVIRAVLFQQSNWDFFGLVIISSMAATVYQIRKKVLPYTIKTLLIMIVLILVTSAAAGLVVYLLKIYLLK